MEGEPYSARSGEGPVPLLERHPNVKGRRKMTEFLTINAANATNGHSLANNTLGIPQQTNPIS